MVRAIQKRTLQTRAKLVDAAKTLVEQGGYDALRVEEVVLRAGVAKGTFFAHFRDKDALMDLLIGANINGFLDEIEQAPPPKGIGDLTRTLKPLHDFMTCERYVFDVILRYSGAAARDQIGDIAMTFERYLTVVSGWLRDGPFRADIDSDLMAEGVQAFAVQAMALQFCALHTDEERDSRLARYLQAWLLPA